jgi:coproporphyrinogen III oxidase-like Fe-S oxidoreductase
MYWTGYRPWLAFGNGAASFVDRVRFSRPRSLVKYYEYVKGDCKKIQPRESDFDMAKTITMCQLRTNSGLNINALKDYMTVQ